MRTFEDHTYPEGCEAHDLIAQACSSCTESVGVSNPCPECGLLDNTPERQAAFERFKASLKPEYVELDRTRKLARRPEGLEFLSSSGNWRSSIIDLTVSPSSLALKYRYPSTPENANVYADPEPEPNVLEPQSALVTQAQVSYSQTMHCCGDQDDEATLVFTRHDSGAGVFMAISAYELVVETPDELEQLIALIRVHYNDMTETSDD